MIFLVVLRGKTLGIFVQIYKKNVIRVLNIKKMYDEIHQKHKHSQYEPVQFPISVKRNNFYLNSAQKCFSRAPIYLTTIPPELPTYNGGPPGMRLAWVFVFVSTAPRRCELKRRLSARKINEVRGVEKS